MTTYRTGTDDGYPAILGDNGDLVVVAKGRTELAERICALLNDAHTPDVDHTRGAAEALAHVRHMLDRACPPATIATVAVRGLLDRAAAELGIAEEYSPVPGYTCPDHPGPLDDARDHVCRLRPTSDERTGA